MNRAVRQWAALSDSEKADIALETAHLPRAYALLQALDHDVADIPVAELNRPRWRCNTTERCVREDGHDGPHSFAGAATAPNPSGGDA